MSVVRSEGWTVRPSFAPHGPTSPVTLLMDELGVTQLAGEPAVAWQTPWSEVTGLRMTTSRSGISIFALIAGVLYQWRRTQPMSRTELDEMRTILTAHGASEVHRARRNSAWAMAVVVIVASCAGYVGGLLHHQGASGEIAALKHLNLNARDVASTWSSSSQSASSLLTSLVPPPGQVQTADPATTTSAPAQASPFALAAVHFQRCLNVASVDDRLFGLAGVVPRYQVSSPVFYSSELGGIQVVSTAQYYDAAPNVALDVREMSRPSFGRCFAQAAGDELVGATTGVTPTLSNGQNFATATFVRGWIRAGDVAVTLPAVQVDHAHLVFVEEAAGHYEVTMFALAIDFPRARATLTGLANSLLARVTTANVLSA